MIKMVNFHRSTWKSQNWDSDGILFFKVENVSWQWRMIQNLRRIWLAFSKLTHGIWWMLTQAPESLKNLHFNGIFLIKASYSILLELKKSTDELCLMTLKIDAKFERKLTCAFKNNMRNLWNFYRLRNSDLILESKMVELYLNKNSKQQDRLDAVWKLYFTVEINE